MTKASAEEMKAQRAYRIARTVSLIQAGKSEQEVADILGVQRSTVLKYMRIVGLGKRGNHHDNIKKILKMYSNGLDLNSIAASTGLHANTARGYLYEGRRHQKNRCQKCKRIGKLERFKEKNICHSCLNPEVEASIEYAVAWKSIENSGAMSCE